jgi:hypothetical protein
MTTEVAARCRLLRVPKRDHSAEECEDAAAVDPGRGRFALADGAAESAQGGLWARLLCEAFVRQDDLQYPWPGWIVPLQRQWADAVSLPAGAEPLPWFLEGRYRDGAFATFLGVTLDGPRWRALAVGDTCLFQVRAGKLEHAFPLTQSAQFSNNPWLIGSRAAPDGIPKRHAVQEGGDWAPGDRLFLMTDALARWFLTAVEAGGKPWMSLEHLLELPDPDLAFAAWVERLRGERHLRNDDTTLVAVGL